MTHEDLVEKVKDALADNALFPLQEKEADDCARAAIAVIYEAMKEPSASIIEAEDERLLSALAAGEIVFAHGIWSAMLSASPLNGGRHAGDN